jgi:hypothetical protein
MMTAAALNAKSANPLRALAIGAFLVGTLDILDAFIFFGLLRGSKPTRILQSIAAGVLGRDAAVAGGASTAAMGLGLHFVIATIIVLLYYTASRRMTQLVERPWVFGSLYGIAVYLVMNLIVVPMSAIGGSGPRPGLPMLNGVLIHIFGVGLVSALAARGASGSELSGR